MNDITRRLKQHYSRTFAEHGATAKGVDWNAESEVLVRYDKMLNVLQKDFVEMSSEPTLLDVGCGWGGLLRRARSRGMNLRYTGIDIVEPMIDHGRKEFADAEFLVADVFNYAAPEPYDFVVCNGLLALKLDASYPAMEGFVKELIHKMFALCRHGIAFNVMSTRVNFMVDQLYYQNPAELLMWLLSEVSPRVRVDHGYSSLSSGRGKLYEYTAYVYRD